MENSHIGWCDHTFNPWTGCAKVSPGCDNCYAWNMSPETRRIWGPKGSRLTRRDAYWDQPDRWHRQVLRDGRRTRVFCGSMCDVFEHRLDLVRHRDRLWEVIERTTALDWQLLTKRPENISRMVPPAWMETWPAHVWVGTSTENQEWANRRAAELVKIPAEIRFLSVEPLLGPIPKLPLDGIHWVIVGGESGSQARPMDLAWARDIRDQSANADVAFFMKQLGGRWNKRHRLDQFPEDLRIQEFPKGTALEVEVALET